MHVARPALELAPQVLERSVECHLDGVCLSPEDLGDPAGREVRSVAECDQLALPVGEHCERFRDDDPLDRFFLEVSWRR